MMVKENTVKNLPPPFTLYGPTFLTLLYPVCTYHPLLFTLNVPNLLASLSVTPLSLSPLNILQQLLSHTLQFYSSFTICALHFLVVHPLTPSLHCHPIPHLSPLPTTPNTYFLHFSLYSYLSIYPTVFHT